MWPYCAWSCLDGFENPFSNAQNAVLITALIGSRDKLNNIIDYEA